MPLNDSLLECELDRMLWDQTFIDHINSYLYASGYHNYRVVNSMVSPTHEDRVWIVRAKDQGVYYQITMDMRELVYSSWSSGNAEAIYRYLTRKLDEKSREDWEYIERQIERQHR